MSFSQVHLRRLAFMALAVLVAIHAIHAATGLGPDGLIEDWVYTAVELAAAVLCLWRAAVVPAERVVWLMIALYVLTWALSDLAWTLWLGNEETVASPNFTDAGYLASYIFAIVGLALLMRSRMRSAHVTLTLDGLVAGLALAAVVAAIFWRPITEAAVGSDLEVATALSYPLLDLGLLCVVGVAFGASGWRPGRTWALLGASLFVTAVADVLFSYMDSIGTVSTSINSLWPLSALLAAGAAWQPRAIRKVERRDVGQMLLPLAFAALALGVLLYGQEDIGTSVPFPAAILAATALVVAVLRGALTYHENLGLLRESRVHALTDTLTGLANRRALTEELAQRLDVDYVQGSSTLVFFDLDGFKAYNDAFGHSAGDELLTRLGAALTRAVLGRGTAFRPGGDEFCVIFDGELDRRDAFVAGAAAALAESGDDFSIRASFGLVVLPAEAGSPTAALRLVDERMYADKGAGRGALRRPVRDVRLEVIAGGDHAAAETHERRGLRGGNS